MRSHSAGSQARNRFTVKCATTKFQAKHKVYVSYLLCIRMDDITIESASHILSDIESQVLALPIPSLIEYAESPLAFIDSSPYVSILHLEHVKSCITSLRSKLGLRYSPRSQGLTDTIQACDDLVNTLIDERLYIANQLLQKYEALHQPPTLEESSSAPSPERRRSSSLKVPEEELASLRRRLLAGGRTDSLTTTPTVDRQNVRHELIQEDIMNELVDLTTSLKLLALKFSHNLISQDMSILNETSEAMVRNTGLFKNIDQNLNHYLQNKTGGKISIWFLIKMVVVLTVVFLVMVLLIKIIPRF